MFVGKDVGMIIWGELIVIFCVLCYVWSVFTSITVLVTRLS